MTQSGFGKLSTGKLLLASAVIAIVSGALVGMSVGYVIHYSAPTTRELLAVVVSDAVGAPDVALPPPVAPTGVVALTPLKLITVSDESSDWPSVATTEAAMRAFAEANNLKLGAVAQPLRVALTGRTTSPGIFEVLALLGKEKTVARLDALAQYLKNL